MAFPQNAVEPKNLWITNLLKSVDSKELHPIEIKLAADILKNINTTFNLACNNRFKFPVTFSAGILSVNKEDFSTKSFDTIFKSADNLLYSAKEAGRNRIEL